MGSSLAIAQEDAASRAASLHVRGAAGCLDPAAIERRIRARSKRITLVPPAANIPRLEVDARKAGAATSVELFVAWPDKRRSRRTLAADSCEEASDAVAFLIALTLDPEATAEAESREASRGAQTRTGAAAAVSGTRADAAQPGAGAGSPKAVAGGPQNGNGASRNSGNAPQRSSDAPLNSSDASQDSGDAARNSGDASQGSSAATAQADRTTRPARSTDAGSTSTAQASTLFAFESFAADIGPQLTTGVAPRVMPGLRIGALLASRGSGLFAPALQLSAAHAWLSGVTEPGGSASFRLTTVRLDLCPLGVRAGPFAARLCATTGAGRLQARGSRSYSPRTSARGWLDLGTSLRASLDLGSILQLSAGVALVAPVRRDQFAFRPEVFHRVDVLCFEGHLGLGVRFP